VYMESEAPYLYSIHDEKFVDIYFSIYTYYTLKLMQIAFKCQVPGKLFLKGVCWLHVPDQCLCTTCI
jgi:hypothetical protein